MGKKYIVPVVPDAMEELHQAVLPQFAWIEEDLQQRVSQERLLECDLIKNNLHSAAINAVLKYVRLSKDDEASNILSDARIEA